MKRVTALEVSPGEAGMFEIGSVKLTPNQIGYAKIGPFQMQFWHLAIVISNALGEPERIGTPKVHLVKWSSALAVVRLSRPSVEITL
jgi:hypothetical protein